MSKLLIQQYYAQLDRILQYGGSRNETSIRGPFQNLLNAYADQRDLLLIPELAVAGTKGKPVYPDGTLKDALRLEYGYWESKDEADDIEEEIRKKTQKGYPLSNILFEDSQTAVLYQNGQEVRRANMKNADDLDRILHAFVHFERPEIVEFQKAIEAFKADVPNILLTLRARVDEAGAANPTFIAARATFLELCRAEINPEVAPDDVREMIIQHILTADIFNVIFDDPHFHRENNIARELERLIETFFFGADRRNALESISHYYKVINAAAASIPDHHEKQKFLKVIYENFYKVYNPKAADRLGVVYTPGEIVHFMLQSVDYLLHKHFNRTLADDDVDILDPATGTGTFICDLMDHLPQAALARKYKTEIHANEVAILPYYIANLNIEYTFKQKMGRYEEFRNICFVDTLDNTAALAYHGKQHSLFGLSSENAERIQRQNSRKISVIIGNPPYNARQENYNYQNSNRAYRDVDRRIKDTYIKHGTAQNQIVVYDMYTRFYRWSMDRLDKNGVLAFITNRSFIDSRAFDGFRKCVQEEFAECYIVDTRSDVRANPKISGTGHNVFGIQTGVALMFLVKKQNASGQCRIHYTELDDTWRKAEKLQWFREHKLQTLDFQLVTPDKNNNWINLADNDWDTLLPLIDKEVKGGKGEGAVFQLFSLGVASHRDEWVYDFSKENLETKMRHFVEVYQNTLADPNFQGKNTIAWDRELNNYLNRRISKTFKSQEIRASLFRPFCKKFHYFDKHFNGMLYQAENIYGKGGNLVIAVNREGTSKPLHCLATTYVVDLHTTGDSQCLPLHRYLPSGERVDNVTDWALAQFRARYASEGVTSSHPLTIPESPDSQITKLDIFHYTYAVLHDPAYRKKYELNLRREFPRLPLYEDFWKWAAWGKSLMDLHLGYETAEPWPLQRIEVSPAESRARSQSSKEALAALRQIVQELDFGEPEKPAAAPKPKLKADKERGTIQIDEATALAGIPPEAWGYLLGNRSALEWVLDQYKEKKPSDPTIAEKFNTYRFADYKEQVIGLLARVCRVSVETVRIVRNMEST